MATIYSGGVGYFWKNKPGLRAGLWRALGWLLRRREWKQRGLERVRMGKIDFSSPEWKVYGGQAAKGVSPQAQRQQ